MSMRRPCASPYFLMLWCSCLIGLGGCSKTLDETIRDLGQEKSVGGQQHLPVSPEEAVTVLLEVAPQNGWEVVSTGDEFDINGPRGKYFRLEAERTIGGKKSVSGVFFSEATGSYVTISDKTGLPEALVEPLIAAIKARRGTSDGP
jgi:hypothetical protein